VLELEEPKQELTIKKEVQEMLQKLQPQQELEFLQGVVVQLQKIMTEPDFLLAQVFRFKT
jgi:hypothetical protein